MESIRASRSATPATGVRPPVLKGLGLGLSLACCSFASAAAEEDSTLNRLVNSLEGRYSNAAQVDAGELDAENNLLFPVFSRVDIPAFGSHVVYLQWPIGAPDGSLQRQRLWTFHADAATGAIGMRFFTLREPDRWLDAHTNPTKVHAMTPADTIGYPDACLLPVAEANGIFQASIPSSCEIVSQATRTTMTLQASITIAADRITYSESGVRPDGSIVFKVPPSGQYAFERIAD